MANFFENIGGALGSALGIYNPNERKQNEQADWYRKKGYEQQMAAIQGMQAPSTTPEMERRLKALESESDTSVPLSQNPNFQGARAKLIGSGAQELAGVTNRQRGLGVQGGFSNIGSPQDIQDRLGVAMAGLGEQARREQEAKRDVAAQTRQELADAHVEWQNARQRAIAAIESGDMATGLANLQQASALRNAMSERLSKSIFTGVSAAAAAGGAPSPGGLGGGGGALATSAPPPQELQYSNYLSYSQPQQSQPWSLMR